MKSCVPKAEYRLLTLSLPPAHGHEDFTLQCGQDIQVSHMHQCHGSESKVYNLRNLRYSTKITQSEHQCTDE
jgi:hypothetical protein